MAAISHEEAIAGTGARHSGLADLATLCLLIFFLTVGVGVSSYALWGELLSNQTDALAVQAVQPGAPAAADAEALPAIEGLCLLSCRPSMLDAASAVRLAAAATLPPDQRGPLLTRARHDLDQAHAAEPLNGSVSIHQAYAAALTPNTSTTYVLGQIERSYTIQPFSKAGGMWRVGAVVRSWSEASPSLKQYALREAVWLPAFTPEQEVDDLFERAGLDLELDLARRAPQA